MPRLKNSEQKLVFAHMWDFISHILETPEIAPLLPEDIREKGRELMAEAFTVADSEILDAKGLYTNE